MNKQPIYLLVGVPGSGKSWVCNQLKDKFEYLAHDDYIGMPYAKHASASARTGTKPVLIETPFSISQLKNPLEVSGNKVIPVFIIESEDVLKDRYYKRDKKLIPTGHLTRMKTYAERAKEWNAFMGTSQEVLEYLKSV